MQIKNIHILSAFLLCFLFFAAPKASPQRLPQEFEKLPKIDIVYTVKKASLTQDYKIIINNKGDIVVSKENYYDKPSKVVHGSIPNSELDGLKKFIADTDIFRFDDAYVDNKDFLEGDSERLKITVNGRTKEIVMSYTSIPPEIQAIINAVEKYKLKYTLAEAKSEKQE